jgi:hypothetical protein
LTQALYQAQHRFVIHDVGLTVQQQASLLTNCRHHAGVAVTGVGDANPTGEIVVGATIVAIQHHPFATVNDDVVIAETGDKCAF